jgi:GNAT superfamily N-acetyltransferase
MHAEAEKKEYRIERLGKDNLNDLDKLYQAVYGKNCPPGYFQKKYDTSYTGTGYLGYFAYNSQGLAIAYYGVLPCFLQYKKDILLSAQSGDTMTHPEYRNRGLFVELCNLTIDHCRQTGVKLLFGFPNQHSYPGFVNKLGWTSTGKLECFCLPVSTLPLAAISEKFGFLKRPYQAYRTAFLKRKLLPRAGIPGPAADGLSGGVYRDEAYLNYKSYSAGTQVIRIGKAMAWVSIRQDLVLGDLSLEGQDFGRTIYALKKITARLGLRRIYFHSSPGTPLHQQFASRYSAIPSFPVIFKDLGAGIPLDELKFTFADIDTF